MVLKRVMVLTQKLLYLRKYKIYNWSYTNLKVFNQRL